MSGPPMRKGKCEMRKWLKLKVIDGGHMYLQSPSDIRQILEVPHKNDKLCEVSTLSHRTLLSMSAEEVLEACDSFYKRETE